VATLAAQLDMAIHIHLHETRAEVEDSIKQYGSRPVERLHQLGLLGPNLIAVHAVHLNSNEISQLADNGSFISHCPTSNMKLGSGIAPVAELLAAGLRIGLGTDGAASNNRLDILQEMRLAALLAKATSGDATTIPAHQALRMATLDGAAALGLAESIGSLVPGKWADLCAIRVDDWPSQPCYCAASHLVYVAGREQVSHVWVAGVLKICDSLPVGIAPTELIDISKSWHNPLRLR
jgi:5-methylthioadenosine/S-adenosylhomocysteine deaminase